MTSEQEVEVKGAVTPVFDALVMTTSQGDIIDLAPLLVELVIYEDIFSPVLTGYVTIRDSVNLFDTLPINGSEKITSKVYSWNYSAELNDDINFLHRTFDVLRVTDIVQLNDYTKQYTLHFASPELKKNESFRLSKGFLNTTISKVVADIFTNDFEAEEPTGLGFPTGQGGLSGFANNFISPYVFSDSIEARYSKVDQEDSIELFVEKTKYTEPVISFPYMKPFDIINWLAGRSLRHSAGRAGTKEVGEAANFLLFENKRGFNFVSIDTLMETKETTTTKFLYGNAAQNRSTTEGHRGVYPERINKLQIQDCYNIVKNMRQGVYASKLYSYDLMSGNVEEHNYDYIEKFKDSESTERKTNGKDYSMLSENNEDLAQRFLSKRLFVVQSPSRSLSPITSDSTERMTDAKERSGVEEYIQKRISQLARLANFRVLFEISGNTKHKVGDMVEIDIKTAVPKNTNIEFTEESNKYYSGYYLITSIKHTINKNEYKMSLEAVKDSYRQPIK